MVNGRVPPQENQAPPQINQDPQQHKASVISPPMTHGKIRPTFVTLAQSMIIQEQAVTIQAQYMTA